MEKKDKQYLVTMDVFLMDTVSVEAKSKKEAFEKAKNNSSFNDGQAEFTLFEIKEDN